MSESTTIAAVSTPNSAGGIGIVRISGGDALKIAAEIFQPVSGADITQSRGYRAHFGKVVFNSQVIDEAVCLVFRAPHSYTGEDTVEISCHGGIYVTRSVLRAALESGAVPAEAGEFTKRAFLNGKIDLAESEAVMNLISAQGEQAASAALNTLDGKLSSKIRAAANEIIAVSAALAAWVDYPYDEIEDTSPEEMLSVLRKVRSDISEIVKSYDSGRVFTEGIDTVIVGRPNVGKSTLMNLLTGYDRSIVTDIAGTTRDIVEESVNLGGMLLRIADTAGIRETDNAVESIGVSLAKKRLERAVLVFAVFDSASELSSEDIEILNGCKDKLCLAVINKTDLPRKADTDIIRAVADETVEISAANGEGADRLEAAVARLLSASSFNPENPCLASERQRNCCVTALRFIDDAVNALECGVTLDAVNVCADCAVDALLELTGERASAAVVEEVFSRFCVGK